MARAWRRALTFEGGWGARAPVSSRELWATLFTLAADASSAVARFSEVSRYSEGRSPETVKRRAHDASVTLWRLAAAILIEVEGHVALLGRDDRNGRRPAMIGDNSFVAEQEHEPRRRECCS